jgi:hypothetical protein
MSSPGIPSVSTIPDLVNTIMQMVRRVTQMLLELKDPALDDEIAMEQSHLENNLLQEGTAVADYFNHYILILGTDFSSGDGTSPSYLS